MEWICSSKLPTISSSCSILFFLIFILCFAFHGVVEREKREARVKCQPRGVVGLRGSKCSMKTVFLVEAKAVLIINNCAASRGSAGEKQAKQIWVALFELDLMQTNHIIHLATAPKLPSFSFPPVKFQFREGKKKRKREKHYHSSAKNFLNLYKYFKI